MEINVNLENKEQAMDLLTQITDKFGITKSNLSEAYNSMKNQGGGNLSKKILNFCRIRLLSFNEAILKLMVPYGDKANVPSSYAYPWKISEGKYGIMHYALGQNNILNGSNYNAGWNYYAIRNENAIGSSIFKVLNAYTHAGSNQIGLLAQNSQWGGYANRSNGYGLQYQDNYEDKHEIRVQTEYYNNTGYGSFYDRRYTFYSKNGNAINQGTPFYATYQTNNHTQMSSAKYGSDALLMNNSPGLQPNVINYKTSTMQYQGMWPVLNIAS